MKKPVIPILFIFYLQLGYFVTQAQDCSQHINLNNWSIQGNPLAQWVVVDSSEVQQNSEGVTSYLFVGNENMINFKLTGTVSVYNDADDDFIGIVFGYQQPTIVAEDAYYNFYLFDWKSREEHQLSYHAYEGFRLSHYDGFITRDEQGTFFFNETNILPTRELIAKKYGDGLGWDYYEEYTIEITYTSDNIKVLVDSVMIFDVEICGNVGKIGFCTTSQPFVIFKDFIYENYSTMYQNAESICHGEVIEFYPYNPICGGKPDYITSVEWDFGDGNITDELTPIHQYADTGYYYISLIINPGSDCADTLYSNAYVKEVPVADLGDDISTPVCSTIQLNSGFNDIDQIWSTGDTTQYIDIINIGNDTTIWLWVDKNGCTDSDTIQILVENINHEIYFPNAFTPNSDGINDVFKPVGTKVFITDYNLKIFNRWGQLLFETSDPDEGWDGSYNGEPCQIAAYTYVMSYRSESCVTNLNENITGTITLIR